MTHTDEIDGVLLSLGVLIKEIYEQQREFEARLFGLWDDLEAVESTLSRLQKIVAKARKGTCRRGDGMD